MTMTTTSPLVAAKCSYFQERNAVLSQISILVGQVLMDAKWACGAAAQPGEFDFYVEQLRTVCNIYLPELSAHSHEWAAQPLSIHGYPERPCRIP